MLDKTYLNKIKKNLLSFAEIRREVIKASGDALHCSKRVIFALQKDDTKTAEELMQTAKDIFLSLNKKHKSDLRVFNEGSYKSALEEYVEANLFYNFLKTGKIGEVADIAVEPEVYIGGMADVPGELYRYAVRSATVHNTEKVKQCLQASEEIVECLLNMNLTGYARQKFDQAKTAYSKTEQIVYDLSLREKV